MIKLGDHVRFLNEPLQGVVTSLNGINAGVTVDDDFELPVLVSQIVKTEQIINPAKTSETPVANKNIIVSKHTGVYFAFERINDNKLELYLHNSLTDFIFCAVYQNKTLAQKLVIAREQSINIGRYLLSDFNTWPELTYVITPISEQFSVQKNFTRKYKFSAKEFHASYKHCYFLNKQAYLFKIDEQITPDALLNLSKHDFSTPTKASTPQKLTISKHIIDLHINKLVDNPESLTPTEMVAIQMEKVSEILHQAHINKLPQLIFIHGVGNQYLKNKIIRYLSMQKELVRSFADADPIVFGGGATQVILS